MTNWNPNKLQADKLIGLHGHDILVVRLVDVPQCLSTQIKI
jgi:hypothetical protein